MLRRQNRTYMLLGYCTAKDGVSCCYSPSFLGTRCLLWQPGIPAGCPLGQLVSSFVRSPLRCYCKSSHSLWHQPPLVPRASRARHFVRFLSDRSLVEICPVASARWALAFARVLSARQLSVAFALTWTRRARPCVRSSSCPPEQPYTLCAGRPCDTDDSYRRYRAVHDTCGFVGVQVAGLVRLTTPP